MKEYETGVALKGISKNSCAIASSYLKESLIAYIGNKRRLLRFLSRHIGRIVENDLGVKTAVDLFAGSGSVSRLLRSMNLLVYSNDIEYYSYILNYAHNSILPSDEKKMFSHFGGIDNILEMLNNTADTKEKYISLYYAPENDENPDIKNERMFYTQENARIIDKVRESIEFMRKNNAIDKKEYFYLLARLIYEAATHANTSGVFKAFHAGFGGKNKDALSRIMKKITMTKLPLYGKVRGKASNMDAFQFIKKSGKTFDIAYLDPPYNQHQYGSNYHLLNTIALWDKPPVKKDIYIDGKKKDKSAIRKDWVKTKSDYCYKDKAEHAFEKLIDNIDSKHIVVSYSTDGIIPYEKFLDILTKRGELSIVTEEYTRYPGGKRSVVNETKNVEYLFLLDTRKKIKTPRSDNLKKIGLVENLRLLLSKPFDSHKDTLFFSDKDGSVEVKLAFKTHVANKDEICFLAAGKSIRFIEVFINHLNKYAVSESHYQIYLYMKNLESALELRDRKAANYFLSNIKRIYVRFNSAKGSIYLKNINENLFRILQQADEIGSKRIIDQLKKGVISKRMPGNIVVSMPSSHG